jgi:uncharacterized membrane protein
MLLSAIILSGTQWVPVAAAFVAVTLALLAWSYRLARTRPDHPSRSLGFRLLCAALKALAIVVLAFSLLEPLITEQRAKPGANLFALVADNSQGLQIHDAGDSRSRGEFLARSLDPATAPWINTLDEGFQLRRFLFDSRLQNVRDFSSLDFAGRASAIGSSLQNLRERFQGRPLAGVLLFTDGNATDIPGPLPDLAGLPPVYPVVIGKSDAIRDVALQRVAVTQSAFEDAPVSAQVEAAAAGFGNAPLVARITDRGGRTVTETNLTPAPRTGDAPATARLQWRPEQPGVSFYQVRAGTAEDIQRGLNPTNSPEATLANNSRIIAVDRGRGPYRILYVAGRPNWEFKFLNRAAQQDDQLNLVGLIRIARREPKFDFRGRAGETGNPLFRGFGDQARETTERYDQPVLTRLNTRDSTELAGGFPRTAEELYAYHAVIIDDLEAAFFSPAQATLLQKFVSERGGGFLMLGGMESFNHGEYQRTPIGEMLPVHLDRPDAANPPGAVKFSLSREGFLQSWARLRDNEPAEQARLADMPAFDVLNPVRDVKPAASVIATATDANGKEHPALAIQRFGKGRTGALMVGDLWRWGMKDAESHADMDKAWRQLLRWLVTDVPNRVDITSEPQPSDPNGAVRLQVRARDEKFEPLDNAAVVIDVETVQFDTAAGTTNLPIRITASPSPDEPGLYEATFVPRATAGFKATTTVTNALGAPAGTAETGWSTDLAAEEFKSLVPNLPLLQEIARRTGGRLVTPDELPALAKELPSNPAPVMETITRPLWNTPAFFTLALAALLTEWGLRRWKGLP